MAQEELDDLGFLLPSELLTDDDLLNDFKTDNNVSKTRTNDDSFGFSSDLSSPVESVTTESDEDDELTRGPAHSTFHHSGDTKHTPKRLNLSSSPESTLRGYKPGSKVAPNSAVGWDLVYAAAEEVARLRLIEDTSAFYSSEKLSLPPSTNQSPVAVARTNRSPASVFYPSSHTQMQTHSSYQRWLQAAKFHHMKQNQIMRDRVREQQQGVMEHHLQNEKGNCTMGGSSSAQGGLSMSAWPTLQQSKQQVSGSSVMRAVFLGENGTKKERVGTGVFMPRRIDSKAYETRKKQGCSTVFLPDREVLALNLNIDSIDAHIQHRAIGSFTTEHDRNHVTTSQQRRSPRLQRVMNQELRLPQEWSY